MRARPSLLAVLLFVLAIAIARSGAVEASVHVLKRAFPRISLHGVDLDTHQRIRTSADVERLRAEAMHLVFGAEALPARMPDRVDQIHDDHLGEVERITVLTDGFKSIAYLIEAQARTDRLAIYHDGHERDFRSFGKPAIETLLGAGYDVLALSMPLAGLNTGPVSAHRALGAFERPLRYFVEPVIVALNWATSRQSYEHTIMIGISGGGWTTNVVAALDRRIDASYPVAGSWPQYLRERVGTWRDAGDFEQQLIGREGFPSYLELYVMATDEGRAQLQVFNFYDPCCFARAYAEDYRDYIAMRAERLGGEFAMHVDRSHAEHEISPAALQRILADADLRDRAPTSLTDTRRRPDAPAQTGRPPR